MLRELTRSTSVALLDHRQQDIVTLVKQRKFVANIFQLQGDRLCVLHLCHVSEFSIGMEWGAAAHGRGDLFFLRMRNLFRESGFHQNVEEYDESNSASCHRRVPGGAGPARGPGATSSIQKRCEENDPASRG